MKKNNRKRATPTRGKLTILAQLCNFIPGHLVGKLARDHGVDGKARTFTAWSHVVAMLYGQLTHAIGLNDVCDALRHHAGWLARIRGATPPSRNGFSHANKVRDAAMAEKLFWDVLSHLQTLQPRFGSGRRGLAHRFRRVIHVVDSTTIQLVASCLDWAKHRRRKAAAKCHLRLDLQSLLPRFAIVDTAGDHDNARARELCAGIRAGEIVIFDRAYLDFSHLFGLMLRDVFWVTRCKGNVQVRVVHKLLPQPVGRILRDDEVVLVTGHARGEYPNRMRRVTAIVELDGKETEMEFLTNNFAWAASTVADLYRCRWQIEVFFKQIKQTLQLCDFLGHSANAVRWQVWTALLLYVLLRFQAFLSGWPHSFTRLFTLLRGVLWDRFHLQELLTFYGTAGERWRMRARPEQAFLPGFAAMGQHQA
ncbi:MAG: IS4 family transposase [Acidobacteriota bacterium]|nr:IS4 family transposase [Acidobacteriota bacterium]